MALTGRFGLSRSSPHPLPPTHLNSVRTELSLQESTRGAPSHTPAPNLPWRGPPSVETRQRLSGSGNVWMKTSRRPVSSES